MANIFYNRIIRKLVVGFGNIFNELTLVRYNPDNSEAERMLVPIAYASKEDYVMRLQSDYNLDKKVQITLPRMSFEMTGMKYDSSRKQNTNIKQFAQKNGAIVSQYNPVPYDFDFTLSLYVRNIEDGTQLIEHILSYFTPDYTIKLNLIPEMGIVKEVPIVLNDVSSEVDYEGDKTRETRIVIWTLNFTVKGFIFGAVSSAGVIKTSITNIYNNISSTDTVSFNLDPYSGVGQYQIGETVYQGFSAGTATATGTVVSWDNTNNYVHLTNIQGNFVSSLPMVGKNTNANYLFIDYDMMPQKLAKVVITPNPSDATANSDYLYTTTITEVPNIT